VNTVSTALRESRHITDEQSCLQRIVRTALTKWTNRVINLKLRELEIVQRSEHALLVYVASFRHYLGLMLITCFPASP
jgi:hypothetical protein